MRFLYVFLVFPNPLHHLDKLRVFSVVAEKGKIGESSRVLGLTQPSISRSIQALEAAFGAKLFVRGRFGTRLTEAGRILYASSLRILREVDDAQVRMKAQAGELAGSITVGSYASLAEYLWPDILVTLQTKYPHLQISIRTEGGLNSFTWLASGKVDLLVTAEPKLSEDATSWSLYSDRFAFYTSRSSKAGVGTEEANSQAILYVPGAYDGHNLAIEDHLKRAGHRFAREYVFDSFTTVKRLASRGLGIAVLPKRLAQEDVESKRLFELELEGFSESGFGLHTIYATCLTERESDPRVRKLITMLRKQFR